MSKRSTKFERNPRDYYRTPYGAVLPLLPHLDADRWFCEPCAGDGVLIEHLEANGHRCSNAFDIEPQTESIRRADALGVDLIFGDLCITNPPWSRDVLHRLIEHLCQMVPTWLLLDADWMHTKQAIPYLEYCQKIVSVGRVSWMENGVSGFDNCCWYLFDSNEAVPTFYHRILEQTKRAGAFDNAPGPKCHTHP